MQKGALVAHNSCISISPPSITACVARACALAAGAHAPNCAQARKHTTRTRWEYAAGSTGELGRCTPHLRGRCRAKLATAGLLLKSVTVTKNEACSSAPLMAGMAQHVQTHPPTLIVIGTSHLSTALYTPRCNARHLATGARSSANSPTLERASAADGRKQLRLMWASGSRRVGLLLCRFAAASARSSSSSRGSPPAWLPQQVCVLVARPLSPACVAADTACGAIACSQHQAACSHSNTQVCAYSAAGAAAAPAALSKAATAGKYLAAVGAAIAASQTESVAEKARLAYLIPVRLIRDVYAAASIVAGECWGAAAGSLQQSWLWLWLLLAAHSLLCAAAVCAHTPTTRLQGLPGVGAGHRQCGVPATAARLPPAQCRPAAEAVL